METDKIKSIFQNLSINTFVNYYYVFETYKNSSSNLEIIQEFKKNLEDWSEKSLNSRASKGKQIFKDNLEIDALRYIISESNPKKVTPEVILKAQEIYVTIQELSSKEGGFKPNDSVKTKQNILEKEFDRIKNDRTLSKEEKLVLVKIRLGQSYYRNELINLWGGCAITGCENLRVLVASHIKPYSECKEFEEKFDKYNGLLLSACYDKLFDAHLISFDVKGKILISKNLSEKDLTSLNIKKTDRLIKLYPENHKYLDLHRREFIKLQKK